MLNQIKRWLYALVGGLLAVLGVISVYFKAKAERMERERDTLKATVHAERTRKRIEKEKKEELSRRESDIKKEGRKDVEDFEGFDNLTDSNDYRGGR